MVFRVDHLVNLIISSMSQEAVIEHNSSTAKEKQGLFCSSYSSSFSTWILHFHTVLWELDRSANGSSRGAWTSIKNLDYAFTLS